MVAVVTGSGLGVERGSGFVLGSRGQLGSSSFGRYGENITVNAATGNLFINRTDEILIGLGTDSIISRSYNSLGNGTDDNGDNWQLGAQRRVANLTGTVNSAGSTVTRYNWDGSSSIYSWDSSANAYVSKDGAGSYDKITFASNVWTWTDGDSRVKENYSYLNGGRITTSEDLDNNILSYGYNAAGRLETITTPSGEVTTISWSGANISQISTRKFDDFTPGPTPNILLTRTRYGYDALNRLVSVTTDLTPENNSVAGETAVTTTYEYDNNNRIISISQTGDAKIEFKYETNGPRVIEYKQTLSSGVVSITKLAYNDTTRVTTIEDDIGQITLLTYDTSNQLKKIELPAAQSGASAQVTEFQYNSNGDVTSEKHPSGLSTNYSYDSSGNMLSRSEPDGTQTSFFYNAQNQLVRTTISPSLEGVTTLPTTGVDVEYYLATYNDIALLGNNLDPVRHFMTAGWSEGRKPNALFDPTYYLQQNPDIAAAGINPLTHFLKWGWREGRAPSATATIQDFIARYVNQTTRYVYDAKQHLRYTISPEGRVTEYEYDGFGNQNSIISYTQKSYNVGILAPDVDRTESTMNAWVLSLGDLSGNLRTDTSYDFRGNIKEVKSFASTNADGLGVGTTKVVTYTYDQFGSLLKRDTTGVTNSEVFTYDGLGRLTYVNDLNNGVTNILFTDSSNTQAVTLANGLVQTSTYNQAGNLISYQTSGTGLTTGKTVYSYDDLGRLRSVSYVDNPNDPAPPVVKNYYLYDAVGRKIADIATDGAIIEYRYDSLDRLIATIRYAVKLSSAALNSLVSSGQSGQPANVSLASVRPSVTGSQWEWRVYDKDDRLIETIDGAGSVTSFTYDARGSLIETKSFSNQLSSTVLDGLKTTAPTTLVLPTADSSKDVLSRNFYDNDGLLVGSLDAAGYFTQIRYDSAGQKIATIAYANLVASNWRATGTFEDIVGSIGTNNRDIKNYFIYDASGRLQYKLDANLRPTEYAYGLSGNISQVIEYGSAIGSSTNYTSAYVSGQISSLDLSNNGATRKSWSVYNQAGLLAHTIDAMGGVTSYYYDNMGQLIRTAQYYTTRTTNSQPTLSTMNAWVNSNSDGSNDRINRYFYDARGQQRYIVDAEGYVTRNDFDLDGRLAISYRYDVSYSATNATTYDVINAAAAAGSLGTYATSSNTYDALGRLATTIDALGTVTQFNYDAFDRVTDRTLAYGTSAAAVTRYTYDVVGRLKTETFEYTYRYEKTSPNLIDTPKSSTITYDYDGLGNMTSRTDARNLTTKYTYDVLGNILSVTTPISLTVDAIISYTYDAFGNRISTTDANGYVSYATYDRLNRLIWQVDQEGYVTKTSYTIGNEISTITRYAVRATSYGAAVTPTVNDNDAQNAVTRFTRDKLGRVSKVTDAMGYFEQYSLNIFGDRTTVSNKLGGITENAFDRRGLLTAETLPIASSAVDGSTVATSVINQYEYDARGNRTKAIEAVGLSEQRTTRYSYDKLNRLTAKTGMAATVAADNSVSPLIAFDVVERYVYDARGNVVATVDTAGGITLSYFDQLDRKIASIDPSGMLSTWGYDANGNADLARVFDKSFDDAYVNNSTFVLPVDPESLSAQVFRIYDIVAGRMPTAAENANWVWRMQNQFASSPSPLEAIAAELLENNDVKTRLGATSNQDFIAQLYQCTFRRAPTTAETNSWLSQMNAGLTRAKMLATFSENPVHRTTVNAMTAQTVISGTPPTPLTNSSYRETTFTYDRSNRQTSSVVSNVLVGRFNSTSYTTTTTILATYTYYDNAGNINRQADGYAKYNYFYYDKAGRKIAQSDKENYFTYYTLDAQGNVTKEERFATRLTGTVSYTSNPATLRASVAGNAQDRVTEFTYDLNGRRLTEERLAVDYSTIGTTGAKTDITNARAIVRYQYNGLGQVVKKVEATGVDLDDPSNPSISHNWSESISYQYDLMGRLITETSSNYEHYSGAQIQRRKDYNYDGLNNIRRSVENSDRETRYIYDSAGRLVQMTDAAGYDHYYDYDMAGRLVRERYQRQTDAANLATLTWEARQMRYDAAGRVTAEAMVKWVSGQSSWQIISENQTSYNAYGDAISRSVNGVVQEVFSYDNAGRVWRSTAGDGVVKLFLYDEDGNQTALITSSGGALPQGYSWSTMTISQAVALLSNNGQSQIGTISVAGMVVTLLRYDARGQNTETRQPLREMTAIGSDLRTIIDQRVYNAFGEVVQEVDIRKHPYDTTSPLMTYVTEYKYNTLGKVIERKSPEVAWTDKNGAVANVRPTENYYYDLSGRLVAVQDANGNLNTRHLLQGTGYGGEEALVLREFHADSGIYRRGFDAYGNVIVSTNEESKQEWYTYDALDRLIQHDNAWRSASIQLTDYYSYDINGNRLRHWNNQLGTGVVETTDYDALGRVTKMVDLGGATTSYAYSWIASAATTGLSSLGGWRRDITNSSGKTSFDLTDAFGHMVDSQDFGGINYDYSYDAANRLILTVNTIGLNSSLTYYNTGLVRQAVKQSDNGQDATISTDLFHYDENGNRTRERHEVTGTRTYNGTSSNVTETLAATVSQDLSIHYDALNRMLTAFQTQGITYPEGTIDVYMNWEYDKASNIRRVKANYHPLDAQGQPLGDLPGQEYWYLYDKMNRFVTTKGVLRGTNASGQTVYGDAARGLADAVIVRGLSGTDISYYLTGQRRTAARTLKSSYNDEYIYYVTFQEQKETYFYGNDGYLESMRVAYGSETYDYSGNATYIPPSAASGDGTLRALYTRDAMGRVTNYSEYAANGTTINYSRASTYNARSELTDDIVFTRRADGSASTATSVYRYGAVETYAGSGEWQGVVSGGTYMGGAVTYSSTTFTDSSTTNRTTTSFRWRQSALRTTETSTGQSPGSSTYSYDDAGTLASVRILETNNTLRNRNVWLRSDAQGFYLERDERDGSITGGDPREVHYYVDGVGVGDISNNGTSDVDYVTGMSLRTASGTGAFRNGATSGTSYADFDQSYDPINGLNYEATATRYTVQDGDTIEGIALRLWGDASYWYLIAEANGLTGTETLAAGRTLTIPNKIHNAHNNSDVYRVYDPNEIIGSTSPNAPKAPKKNKCGAFGQILMVAVAVAITVIAPVGGSTIGATLANAALASVASQGVGIATGAQNSFSFKSLALSVVTAGVMKGINSTGFFSSNAIGESFAAGTSGIKNAALAMGLQSMASNVLSQGIGVATGLQSKFNWAGVATAGIGGAIGQSGFGKSLNLAGKAAGYVNGMAGGLAGAAAESLITGNSFGDTLISSLPSIIGNTIGNLAADALSKPRLGYADVGSDDGVAGGTQNNPSVTASAETTSGGNSAAVAAAVNAGQRQQTTQAADDANTIVVTANKHWGEDLRALPQNVFNYIEQQTSEPWMAHAAAHQYLAGQGSIQAQVEIGPMRIPSLTGPSLVSSLGWDRRTMLAPDRDVSGGYAFRAAPRISAEQAADLAFWRNPAPMGLGDIAYIRARNNGLPLERALAAQALGNNVQDLIVGAAVGRARGPQEVFARARIYSDGSLRTPDGKFASVSGMQAPGTGSSARFADFLKSNNVNVVGLEMEIAGPLGARRYDIVTRNADGTLHGLEVKSGGASRNTYQDFTDRHVNRFGAVGTGRISGEVMTGTSVVYLPGGY